MWPPSDKTEHLLTTDPNDDLLTSTPGSLISPSLSINNPSSSTQIISSLSLRSSDPTTAKKPPSQITIEIKGENEEQEEEEEEEYYCNERGRRCLKYTAYAAAIGTALFTGIGFLAKASVNLAYIAIGGAVTGATPTAVAASCFHRDGENIIGTRSTSQDDNFNHLQNHRSLKP